MKEYPDPNFSVSIREVAFDNDPAFARLYLGCFSVECNYAVSIVFVPAFRTPETWPPTKEYAASFDLDAPPDAIAARWATAMCAGLVVSSGADEALETFVSAVHGEEARLFTVPAPDFDALSREVGALLEERPQIAWRPFGAGGVPVSELEATRLVRLLRARVWKPAFLSAYGAELLCL